MSWWMKNWKKSSEMRDERLHHFHILSRVTCTGRHFSALFGILGQVRFVERVLCVG